MLLTAVAVSLMLLDALPWPHGDLNKPDDPNEMWTAASNIHKNTNECRYGIVAVEENRRVIACVSDAQL